MQSREQAQSQGQNQPHLDGKRTGLSPDPPQSSKGSEQQRSKGLFINNNHILHLALLESWIKNWKKGAKLFSKTFYFLKFSH